MLRHTHLYPIYDEMLALTHTDIIVGTGTHLFSNLLAPRMGFPADLGFFFPLSFSRCSRCFSFASVVNPLATLRTSTSRRGAARARTWCSTKVGYSGLSWCRLMMCVMMASERATKSSLDLGVDFRISSRSASDEPKYKGQAWLEHTRESIRCTHTHTFDGGRPEQLRGIFEIGFKLALFLELRFGMRIEHRVLIVLDLVIPRGEPGLSLCLFLCELLLESSFLLWGSYWRSDRCRLLLIRRCFPITLQRIASIREIRLSRILFRMGRTGESSPEPSALIISNETATRKKRVVLPQSDIGTFGNEKGA